MVASRSAAVSVFFCARRSSSGAWEISSTLRTSLRIVLGTMPCARL